jgi:hypothetical protein
MVEFPGLTAIHQSILQICRSKIMRDFPQVKIPGKVNTVAMVEPPHVVPEGFHPVWTNAKFKPWTRLCWSFLVEDGSFGSEQRLMEAECWRPTIGPTDHCHVDKVRLQVSVSVSEPISSYLNQPTCRAQVRDGTTSLLRRTKLA